MSFTLGPGVEVGNGSYLCVLGADTKTVHLIVQFGSRTCKCFGDDHARAIRYHAHDVCAFVGVSMDKLISLGEVKRLIFTREIQPPLKDPRRYLLAVGRWLSQVWPAVEAQHGAWKESKCLDKDYPIQPAMIATVAKHLHEPFKVFRGRFCHRPYETHEILGDALLAFCVQRGNWEPIRESKAVSIARQAELAKHLVGQAIYVLERENYLQRGQDGALEFSKKLAVRAWGDTVMAFHAQH